MNDETTVIEKPEAEEPAKPQAVKKADAPKPVERTVLPVKKARFKLADQVRAVYSVVAESGTLPEDVVKPEYWRDIGEILRPGDRIEISTDDMTWCGDCVVYDSGRLFAHVRFMTLVKFEPTQDTKDGLDGLKVAYRGQYHRYCIVKENPDGQITVIKHGFQNQAKAMEGLMEYRREALRNP